MLLPRKRYRLRRGVFLRKDGVNEGFWKKTRRLRSSFGYSAVVCVLFVGSNVRLSGHTEAGQRVKKACVPLHEFLLMKC